MNIDISKPHFTSSYPTPNPDGAKVKTVEFFLLEEILSFIDPTNRKCLSLINKNWYEVIKGKVFVWQAIIEKKHPSEVRVEPFSSNIQNTAYLSKDGDVRRLTANLTQTVADIRNSKDNNNKSIGRSEPLVSQKKEQSVPHKMIASSSINVSDLSTLLFQKIQTEISPVKTAQEWLAQGQEEFVHRKYSLALGSFTHALVLSEKQEKWKDVILAMEGLAAAFLDQNQFVVASKLYASCLKMCSSNSLEKFPDQEEHFFKKLKEVEKKFLNYHQLAPSEQPYSKEIKDSLQALKKIKKTQFGAHANTFEDLKKRLELLFRSRRECQCFAKKAADELLKLSKSKIDIASALKLILNTVEHAENLDPNSFKKIKHNQKVLMSLRHTAIQKLEGQEEISQISLYLTEIFKDFFKELIVESIVQWGISSDKFAFAGIGSMARSEMCLYSDIEYILLLRENTPQIKARFKILCQLIELKVIQLGETPFPILKQGTESPMGRGFSLDIAGHTPLCEIFTLMATPQQLAAYQNPEYFTGGNLVTVNALREACFLYGDNSLCQTYRKEMNLILDAPSDLIFPCSNKMLTIGKSSLQNHSAENYAPSQARQCIEIILKPNNLIKDPTNPNRYIPLPGTKAPIARIYDIGLEYLVNPSQYPSAIHQGSVVIMRKEEHLTVRQKYGFELGKAALEDFKPVLELKYFSDKSYVTIKSDLYRLVNQFMAFLTLYLKLRSYNYWERCKELKDNKKISKENYYVLTSIMDKIFQLRLETQFAYKEECETLYLSGKEQIKASSAQLKQIRDIYKLLYALSNVLEHTIRDRIDTHVLTAAKLFPSQGFEQEGDLYVRFRQFYKAKRAYEKELALTLDSEPQGLTQKLRDCILMINGQQHILKKLWQKFNARSKESKSPYTELDDAVRSHHSQFCLAEKDVFYEEESSSSDKENKPFNNSLFYQFFMKEPFNFMAAYVDIALEGPNKELALFYIHTLMQMLKENLPLDLNLRWSKILVDYFSSNSDFLPVWFELSHPFFNILIEKGSTFKEPPLSISLISQYAYGAIKANQLDFAKQYLTFAKNQPQSTAMMVAIEDAFALLAYASAEYQAVQAHLEKALELAQQFKMGEKLIQDKLACWKKVVAENSYQLSSSAVFFEVILNNQEKAEQLIKMNNSLLALPYLEQEYVQTPDREISVSEHSYLQIIDILYREAEAYIPQFIELFKNYKDLDHQVSPSFPAYLARPDKASLRALAEKYPARFIIALTYGKIQAIKRVIRIGQEKAEDKLDRVKPFLQCFEEDLASLERVLGEHFPKSVEMELYINYAACAQDIQAYAEAESYLLKALAIFEKHESKNKLEVDIYVELGRLYKNKKELEKAKVYYKKAIQTISEDKSKDNPNLLLFIYDGLTAIAIMEKNSMEAKAFMTKTLEHVVTLDLKEYSSQMLSKLKELCSIFLEQKEINHFLDLLRQNLLHIKSISKDQYRDFFGAALGYLFNNQSILTAEQQSQSILLIHEYSDQDPSNSMAHIVLANLYSDHSDYKNYIKHYLKVLDLEPGLGIEIYPQLTQVYFSIYGDVEKAIFYTEKTIELSPGSDHYQMLGEFCFIYSEMISDSGKQQQYRKKAEEAFQAGLKMELNSGLHTELGNLYLHTKRYEEGIKQFILAIQQGDGSELTYIKEDLKTVCLELQAEIKQHGEAPVLAVDLAYFLLIKTYVQTMQIEKAKTELSFFAAKFTSQEGMAYRLFRIVQDLIAKN